MPSVLTHLHYRDANEKKAASVGGFVGTREAQSPA
jgi:hypothetical protein